MNSIDFHRLGTFWARAGPEARRKRKEKGRGGSQAKSWCSRRNSSQSEWWKQDRFPQ